ncbi:MAG: hypothetical protein Q4C83_01300 [Candidatus Saccharibacteria bacterium]|nr:hypothetical protein [Candidatus Saccharibacteria bacterium]
MSTATIKREFLSQKFDSNTDPKSIGYDVGQKFDEAGLPNPYIEDHDQIDKDDDDRDGRGLPANFAVSTAVAPVDTDATRVFVFDDNDFE